MYAVNMTNRSDIGAALSHARKATGLTQDDLAAITGISRPTIARDETHGSTVTVERLLKYARALGVDFRIVAGKAPAVGLEPVTYRFQTEGSAA